MDPITAITLTPDAGSGARGLIDLGIPFPEGALTDAANVLAM